MKILQLFNICMMSSLLFVSCNSFNDSTPPHAYSETPKNLDGEWQAIAVSRNGSDITNDLDLSQCLMTLGNDNSYSLNSKIPFVVHKDGKWWLDSDLYPFHISFQENGSSVESKLSLSYYTLNGIRRMSLSFAPGCQSNTYTYVFEKKTN